MQSPYLHVSYFSHWHQADPDFLLPQMLVGGVVDAPITPVPQWLADILKQRRWR
ncbi:MAG: hypothetical protein U0528_09550 [Anaerolineae bacterium]